MNVRIYNQVIMYFMSDILFMIIFFLYFQCFIFLDDAQGVADILEKLIKDNEASAMTCLRQIYENQRKLKN